MKYCGPLRFLLEYHVSGICLKDGLILLMSTWQKDYPYNLLVGILISASLIQTCSIKELQSGLGVYNFRILGGGGGGGKKKKKTPLNKKINFPFPPPPPPPDSI